jgi:hypothetical protein
MAAFSWPLILCKSIFFEVPFMVFSIRMFPTIRPRVLSNLQILKMGAEAGFYAEITDRF